MSCAFMLHQVELFSQKQDLGCLPQVCSTQASQLTGHSMCERLCTTAQHRLWQASEHRRVSAIALFQVDHSSRAQSLTHYLLICLARLETGPSEQLHHTFTLQLLQHQQQPSSHQAVPELPALAYYCCQTAVWSLRALASTVAPLHVLLARPGGCAQNSSSC